MKGFSPFHQEKKTVTAGRIVEAKQQRRLPTYKDPLPRKTLAKSFADEASKITPEREKIKKHKLDKGYQKKRKEEIKIEDAGDKNMGRTAG